MALKEKHLADGEEIQMDLRSHWKALVLPLLLLVVLIAIVGATAALTQDTDWGTWAVAVVAVIAVVLAVIGTLIPVWRWNSSRYVFTNRRVSYRHGLLTKKGRDIPLYRINDVAIEKGPIDRVLGCGTLVISDATDKAGMELTDVPDVETVQVTLQNLLFQHDDGSDDGEHPPTEPQRPRGF
ncbi:MAG TPA: PH domain-containing protein [Candidatus Janibacter merdipullorum]|nr:PH domain-containing protein [Candidatus Janibacter merdipullorum]